MLIECLNQQRSLIPLLFLCLTLVSCSYVGPYVDPPEPDVIDGPGLFTGDKGHYSLVGDGEESDAGLESNKVDAVNFAEFKAYQRWKALDRNSQEYQEFLQWSEFQRLKAAQ